MNDLCAASRDVKSLLIGRLQPDFLIICLFLFYLSPPSLYFLHNTQHLREQFIFQMEMHTYGVHANQMTACHTFVMNLCAKADGTKNTKRTF